MKQLILIALFVGNFALDSFAQNFISKATIEFEVKTNIKKTMGNSGFAEMMKDQMPTFRTGYYHFTFADNKSVYKFHHWNEKEKMPEWFRKSEEENSWYFDHTAGKFNMQKNIYGSNFNVDDSIQNIEWKLSNENRIIAGFNCRKAVGKIMDSVYVFAFFTEEIMIPGGPVSINGLPGMVLGLTIPRLYTSWIATKIMVNDVNVAAIKPVTVKKYFTYQSLEKELVTRSKEWESSDNPDSKQWINQFRWNGLL
jgi:GLPGLI family protein